MGAIALPVVLIAPTPHNGMGRSYKGAVNYADPAPAPPMTAASTPVQANAQKVYDVHRSDLPLSCPMPSMALWNSHPRVYLAIQAEGGESQCPYCSAHFVLVD